MAAVSATFVPGSPSGLCSRPRSPNSSATARAMFIDEAHTGLGARNLVEYKPTEYLPDIITTPGYHEFESGPLRAAVLQDETEYSRIPYLLMMPKYEPIAALTTNWDKLMNAFFALFYCHAMLWSVGVRHGDISQSNLIWDPMMGKPKLCDFDFNLTHIPPEVGAADVGPNRPVGFSNTGTWIFMADDLLTEEAMAGHVKRVYRHEVEAFVAVLVWVAYRYVDGKLRHNPPFENWIHRDYLHVSAERMYTLGKIERGRFLQPSGLPDDLLAIIRLTISEMSAHQRRVGTLEIEIDAAARRRKRFPDAPAPVELLEDYNDLRALPTKILTWDIFTQLPSATRFVHLLNERILNASKEGLDRKI